MHKFFNIIRFHKTNTLLVKNYYKILGLPIRATDNEVKKAFLNLAKTFHPDVNKNPGAKEKFAEILEAYDILSDENKKNVYDKSGLTAAQQEDLEFESKKSLLNKGFYSDRIEYSSEEELEVGQYDKDLEMMIKRSNDLFGEKQYDLQNYYTMPDFFYPIATEVNLTFIEAVKGCNKTVHYRSYAICADCKGEFCQKCSYTGFKLQDAFENIEIPSGIENDENSGFVIKLKGKGNEYKLKDDIKVNVTDVYVKFKVNEDEYFKREKMNINTDNFVSVSQYVLGGKIVIGTVHGNKEIEVPSYADKVVIKNFGVNKKGDHIVNIKIRLPSELNQEQERIFKEIRKYEL